MDDGQEDEEEEEEEEHTFLHGSLPRVAMATVTAGLRCPPETPPLTRTPSITPSPHLGESQCCYFIINLILDFRQFGCYPQFTEKKSPLLPRDKTDWATEALPKVIRIKVPTLKSILGIGSNDNITMNVLSLIIHQSSASPLKLDLNLRSYSMYTNNHKFLTK